MIEDYNPILEIAYCIENQFEPDTRLILMVSGMISMRGEKPAYFRWVDELFNKSVVFCIKENLIQ